MSEWKEGIWLATSALVVSVFFLFLNTISSAIGEATRIEQSNIDNVEVLKEYYKIGRYDDVIVNQADVVNCIYEYKGKYDVCATSAITADNYSTVTYDCVWNSSTGDASYVSSYINGKLSSSATFRAFLSKDASGTIKCIQFKRIS